MYKQTGTRKYPHALIKLFLLQATEEGKGGLSPIQIFGNCSGTMATGQKNTQACLSEKKHSNSLHIECHLHTLIYLAVTEILLQNDACLLDYLSFGFLLYKNSKKKKSTKPVLSTPSAVALGRILLPQRRGAPHPPREKVTLILLTLHLLKQTEKPWCSGFLQGQLSLPCSSQARIVPPALKAEDVLSSSPAAVTSHLLQSLLLKRKFPAHAEGKSQQRDTQRKEGHFIVSVLLSATSTRDQQSETTAPTPQCHSEWRFPAPSWLVQSFLFLLFFLQVGAKGSIWMPGR